MATHAVSYDGGSAGPAFKSCSLILSSTGFSPLEMLPLLPRAACTARRVRVGRTSRPGLCRRRMEDWCPRRRGSWGDDGLSDTIATAFARYEFTYFSSDETTDRLSRFYKPKTSVTILLGLDLILSKIQLDFGIRYISLDLDILALSRFGLDCSLHQKYKTT